MSLRDKLILKVLVNTGKNTENKNWKCLIPNCSNYSINSHLQQRNGLLDNISENGHLVQIKPVNFFNIERDGHMKFNLISNRAALSEPLFCSDHDNNFFKSIESLEIDFDNYNTQLLFSYRSLCSELRKKQKSFEQLNKVHTSNIIQTYCTNEYRNKIFNVKTETELSIKSIETIKSLMENEFNNLNEENLIFKTYEYDLIKVSVSAAFNPIHPNSSQLADLLDHKIALCTVFINVIPTKTKLIVIVGYLKAYCDNWIVNYVKSWDRLNAIELQKKLTDLILTRVETWAIAPSILNEMSRATKEKALEYWSQNAANFSSDQSTDLNIFSVEGQNN